MRYEPTQIAYRAFQVAGDHPLVGAGPGADAFTHPRSDKGAFLTRLEPRHNDYLTCLEDYGLIGYGLAMVFIWGVTLKLFRPLLAGQPLAGSRAGRHRLRVLGRAAPRPLALRF